MSAKTFDRGAPTEGADVSTAVAWCLWQNFNLSSYKRGFALAADVPIANVDTDIFNTPIASYSMAAPQAWYSLAAPVGNTMNLATITWWYVNLTFANTSGSQQGLYVKASMVINEQDPAGPDAERSAAVTIPAGSFAMVRIDLLNDWGRYKIDNVSIATWGIHVMAKTAAAGAGINCKAVDAGYGLPASYWGGLQVLSPRLYNPNPANEMYP